MALTPSRRGAALLGRLLRARGGPQPGFAVSVRQFAQTSNEDEYKRFHASKERAHVTVRLRERHAHAVLRLAWAPWALTLRSSSGRSTATSLSLLWTRRW